MNEMGGFGIRWGDRVKVKKNDIESEENENVMERKKREMNAKGVWKRGMEAFLNQSLNDE